MRLTPAAGLAAWVTYLDCNCDRNSKGVYSQTTLLDLQVLVLRTEFYPAVVDE
ncbi:MAG: hypothetical protein AAF329_07855 [Cyanobacteria bacterium P01_A01_bin.17]